jgi:superfamily II DNA helicase RecQ
MVVMPTGGSKSMCFSAARIDARRHHTGHIAPHSTHEDQVDALNANVLQRVSSTVLSQ